MTYFTTLHGKSLAHTTSGPRPGSARSAGRFCKPLVCFVPDGNWNDNLLSLPECT
jgi:hypothetical protein